MKDKRTGVLMGGMSAEREVSLKSGEAICEALAARGYATVPVFVDRDVDQVLRQDPIDVAVIALHGTYGEDGCIQGLLELMGIPYTGPGVTESALCMDKLRTKQLMQLSGVRTPPYYTVGAGDLARLSELHGGFGFPVFVKPRRQGSSLGAGKAHDLDELRARAEQSLRFDTEALVERFVGGRELAIAVLDGRALGAVEIEVAGGVYDYRTKYVSTSNHYHLPPRLPVAQNDALANMAERAVAAVGARGAVRVDLLLSEGDNAYVLEVNTLPGMTPTSLLPKIAKAAGLDFGDLCEAILSRATLHAGARAALGDEASPQADSEQLEHMPAVPARPSV